MVITDTKFITRTGILLALVLLFQFLGRFIPLGPNSNFIVGPLVNASLIIAATFAGLWSGALIAVIAPFGAILTGAAVPLPFAPFIAIGNFIFVLFYYILRENKIMGLVAGSFVKFGFLYASIAIFLSLYSVPPKIATLLYFSFGWPQLVTAIVGGAIALAVMHPLKKTVK